VRGSELGSLLAGSVDAVNLPLSLDKEAFKRSPGATVLHSDEYVIDAEKIIRHDFDLLGSGKRDLSEAATDTSGAGSKTGSYRKINWHRDFKSGLEWEPDVLYTDIPIIRGDGSDIIVPWELSRFQHLPTLGIAYWIVGDERYAREFVDEIRDWQDNNPPLYGVNWTCPMDVAIRAVNWIWGYGFFSGSPQLDDGFLTGFLKSLYVHGKYIEANLERSSRLAPLARPLLQNRLGPSVTTDVWRGLRTNHYVADLVGLLYIGTLFSGARAGKKWRCFAARELIKGMGEQVYPDGVDYEGSISYHRLVTELFLSATLLGVKNGISFPVSYLERLEKMVEFVMHYTKPDGMAPQIGDNDDGRLHVLEGYGRQNPADHRHILSVGAALLERSDLADAAGGFDAEAFWLVGEKRKPGRGKAGDPNDHLSSRGFPSGGYYVMRSHNLYMIVDCIPADPRAPSGHKHNSRLSCELYAYDKSFIVDPGAYIYTADKEMRNIFRSTAYHNTVVVDGDEQNRFDEDDLFSLGMDAAVRVNKWEAGADNDILDAEHYGYRRLEHPVTHRRQILFCKQGGYWVVKDTLTGEGVHQLDLYFHLCPGEVEPAGDHPLAVKTKTEGANLAIIPLETEGLGMEIEEGWVSYRYGVKERAPVVRYSKHSEAPTSFCSVLCPYVGKIDMNEVAGEAASIAEALL